MIVNRFETVLADTPRARELHYHVRYRVFCEETGFEDAARFPDAMERDEYDARAAHFIVWDRLERDWIGAMRLVPAAGQTLPCEAICASPLAGLDTRRGSAVEFSRLCVLAKHRKTEQGFQFGLLTRDGERRGRETSVFFRQEDQEIFLRLLRASFAWGKAHGVEYCYFIINRALSRYLTRCGVPLEVVGEPVEHRGTRTPQAYQIHAAEAGMRDALPGYERLLQHAPAYVTHTDFVHRRQQLPLPGDAAGAAAVPQEVVSAQQRFGRYGNSPAPYRANADERAA